MRRVESHEERAVRAAARRASTAIDGVRRYGRPARRTPTVLFSVEGRTGARCTSTSPRRGVNAPASSFYALEASRWIGLGDAGAVRAGLAPYTSDDDVDRLLAGVAELAR